MIYIFVDIYNVIHAVDMNLKNQFFSSLLHYKKKHRLIWHEKNLFNKQPHVIHIFQQVNNETIKYYFQGCKLNIHFSVSFCWLELDEQQQFTPDKKKSAHI